MIRLAAVLLAGASLAACASPCAQETRSLMGSDNRYGGIAEAQGGCRGDAAPVSRANLREYSQ